MKLAIINAIGGILAAIKINKISDKEVKEAINRTFLSVRKVMRPFEKDRDDMAAKFQEDWAEPNADHEAYEAALQDLNETLVKMLNEREADIDFSTVKAEKLCDPDLWGSDVTLGEIENAVNYLIKYGIAEE